MHDSWINRRLRSLPGVWQFHTSMQGVMSAVATQGKERCSAVYMLCTVYHTIIRSKSNCTHWSAHSMMRMSMNMHADAAATPKQASDARHETIFCHSLVGAQHDAHLDELAGVARQAALEPKQRHDVANAIVTLDDLRHRHARVPTGARCGYVKVSMMQGVLSNVRRHFRHRHAGVPAWAECMA